MKTNNIPLAATLRIIRRIADGESGSDALMAWEQISIATLKRHIADAREMGADIVSIKIGNASFYRLENWDSICEKLKAWGKLMEGQTLMCDEEITHHDQNGHPLRRDDRVSKINGGIFRIKHLSPGRTVILDNGESVQEDGLKKQF